MVANMKLYKKGYQRIKIGIPSWGTLVFEVGELEKELLLYVAQNKHAPIWRFIEKKQMTSRYFISNVYRAAFKLHDKRLITISNTGMCGGYWMRITDWGEALAKELEKRAT